MDEGPIFLGIAGGSASGKSAVAREVAALLPQSFSAVLSMDDYYLHPNDMHEALSGFTNWDTPAAMNWDSLLQDLAALRQGATITPPFDSTLYVAEAGNPTSRGRPINSAPLIMIEGLFSLYEPTIRNQLACAIYVDATEQLRRKRRARAAEASGYYEAVQRPMHIQFVEPTRRYADLDLRSDKRSAAELASEVVALLHSRNLLGLENDA